MKWFKHMTNSLDDPFIHALLDEYGAAGYLAYFGIIEIFCKELGRDLSKELLISPVYLRRKLRTSQGKLQQVYDFCQSFGKLSVNFSEKEWKFGIPKIAEIKDNYTKDLQASGKELSKYKEVRIKKKIKKKIKEYSMNSREFILSKLLLDYIVSRKPDFKKPDLQTWAKHIDLMMRKDKREPSVINAVIRWCQADSFWQDNILSTSKLRKQFDKLELKMKKEKGEPDAGKDPDYTETAF